MSEYILLSDISLKKDCNFTADEIAIIKKNSVVEILYTVGPWSKIKYMDKEGWLYPFDTSNSFLLEENSNSPVKIGDAVFIKSKKDVIHDEYGKVLIVKKNNSRLFYIVIEILANPKLIRIKDLKDKLYWVKPSQIEKISSSILESSNEGNTWPDYLYKIGEFFGTNPNTNLVSDPEYINKAATMWYAKKDNSEDQGIKWQTARDYITGLELDNLRNIFGMPYQYMPIADMRLSGVNKSDDKGGEVRNGSVDFNATTIKSLGVKYSEKIITRMPLLIMVPGVADFMAGFDANDREKMLKSMISDMRGVDESTFINSFTTTMKGTRASFYNMYPAWDDYYKYVNPLARAAAVFMGIGDMEFVKGIQLKNMNWSDSDIKPKIFKDICSYRGACGFYIQSANQISEDINTNTTQSALANKVNSLSDQGRELIFLSSSVDGALESVVSKSSKVVESVAGTAGNAGATIAGAVTGTEFVKKFEKSGGVVNAIMSGISNTIAGSKMLFPELWQDSQFTRDYSFTIKLDSPDNDPLSLYLNIVLPLIHLICLAAPRSMGPTVYASPFLVKAYYQGFFNVNMGIISSMNINKGNEGAWTLKNIPTVVEVNVTIRDLFSNNLTISKNQNTDLNFITNTPLLDYVANLCGVNINEPDFSKVVTLYSILLENAVSDYLTNQWNRITNWFASGKQNLYESVLAGNFNPLRWNRR